MITGSAFSEDNKIKALPFLETLCIYVCEGFIVVSTGEH